MLSRTAEETSGRVVGGRESDPGTFPWIVGLLDSFGFNFCGGALIKSNYILTAAHCLHNKRVEELTAVIGLNDLDMAFLFNRVYRLRQVILHPGFVHSNWSHDIALIKLSSPIVHLEPICLPERNQRYFDALIVAGWGKTSSHHSLNSLKPNKLHQVSLPQVDQYFCEQTWLDNYVANDQMCAGSAGKDTCIYDSGSPLMSFSGHGYRSASLAGVTSFGSRRCGDPDKPGVYTRVASYLDWIQVNTRDSVCWTTLIPMQIEERRAKTKKEAKYERIVTELRKPLLFKLIYCRPSRSARKWHQVLEEVSQEKGMSLWCMCDSACLLLLFGWEINLSSLLLFSSSFCTTS